MSSGESDGGSLLSFNEATSCGLVPGHTERLRTRKHSGLAVKTLSIDFTARTNDRLSM